MSTCTLGQGFALNKNASYKASGLIGHTGFDYNCGFGTPIHSLYDGTVYKVLSKNRSANDGSGFTGVFMIVDDGLECFEWLVGHCDPSVAEGQWINKGNIIGTEANHGIVYQGGQLITLGMQAAGDKRGAHRHYQKRPVMKVSRSQPQYHYLTRYGDSYAGTWYYDDGYYQIFDYDNGLNGCVDPTLPVLQRTLSLGMSGYDVFVAQRILFKLGFLAASPTGYFGLLTMRAVSAYQNSLGFIPVGSVGPKTRAALSALLSTPPLLSAE